MIHIRIKNYLNQLYPNPVCELNFGNDFELLVAVVLSAQCTDKRVNQVTEHLFEKYKKIEDFANADVLELEKDIYSCGFYKNKAKNIKLLSNQILTLFDGKVPNNFKDLTSLAGVGRKTANVVLSVAFNKNAIAVDTHVFRVSKRLGLSSEKTPEKTEQSLRKIFDEKDWSKLHYQMVLFGRYVCKAKNPQCQNCKLKDICKKGEKNVYW